MSEMILDSLLLITVSYINKTGKLPKRGVTIEREGFKHRYPLTKVLDLAARLAKMRRPNSEAAPKYVLLVLQRAISEVRRKRRRAAFRFYPNSTQQVVGEYNDMVVDLRAGRSNVTGMAYNRLKRILDDSDALTTPQEGQAALALLRRAELVIVDTPVEAARMQHYLARQGLVLLCVTSAQTQNLRTPEPVTAWSEPIVDHQ
ncbi:hypothetical protein EVJ02_17420 [Salmonella enterica subsp. enterica serovar Kedougou]|nr:hypothetical protein [Salmonella enterica subsp. enterica serovar Braenderup]ECG2575401.1 hypothetical protein [Salmonella enterica subsp. enterica serovar Kedougou]